MKIQSTPLGGVLLLEPDIHDDARGHFMEVWRDDNYAAHGITEPFVQDNVSFSRKNVLRGLHFQAPAAQAKLVTCLHGEVYDVVVDVRRSSPTFGQWFGCRLSLGSGRQLYIAPGFAHGFVVTSESATFLYKCTQAYHPKQQYSIRWNDPDIGIQWPVSTPILSDKDRDAPRLADVDPDALLF